MKQQNPVTHGAVPAPLQSSDAKTTSVFQEITSVTETMTVEIGATKLETNVMCGSTPQAGLIMSKVIVWESIREGGRGKTGATGRRAGATRCDTSTGLAVNGLCQTI